MRVYLISSVKDPYQLPLGVFGTLRECAIFIGVTVDHLKHCKVYGNNGIYCTKNFLVEGVVIEKT